VLVAEELEGAGQEDVHRFAQVVVVAHPAAVVHRLVGGADAGGGVAVLEVVVLVALAQLQRGLPAAVEAVGQLGEHVAGGPLVAAPVRRGIGGARDLEQAAAGRGRQAHGGRVGVVVLDRGDQRQRGRRRDVPLHRAVAQVLAGVGALVEIVAVGVGNHAARPHRAILVQRRGDVGLQVVVVPGAGGNAGGGGEILLRPLAHQVHHPARLAGALEQAGGPAQHLHPLVDGQVQLLVAGQRVVGRNAVVGHAQRVAAGAVLALGGVVGDHGDAGDLVEHVGHGEQALVLDALAGDDGDRLRNLAQAERLLAADAGLAGVALAGAGDHHRRQFLGERFRPGATGAGGGQQQHDGLEPRSRAAARAFLPVHCFFSLVQKTCSGFICEWLRMAAN